MAGGSAAIVIAPHWQQRNARHTAHEDITTSFLPWSGLKVNSLEPKPNVRAFAQLLSSVAVPQFISVEQFGQFIWVDFG